MRLQDGGAIDLEAPVKLPFPPPDEAFPEAGHTPKSLKTGVDSPIGHKLTGILFFTAAQLPSVAALERQTKGLYRVTGDGLFTG